MGRKKMSRPHIARNHRWDRADGTTPKKGEGRKGERKTEAVSPDEKSGWCEIDEDSGRKRREKERGGQWWGIRRRKSGPTVTWGGPGEKKKVPILVEATRQWDLVK